MEEERSAHRLPAGPGETDVRLAARLLKGRTIAVLTGAGISTESGIPDYRGPDGPRRKTQPIQYRDFISSESARARYWARSAMGWRTVAAARPNPAHHALARIERAGILSGVVTQNVDGLHRAAGSDVVVELHGSLAEVICLSCGAMESRDALQVRMLAMNPGWRAEVGIVAPDGDVELAESATQSFRVPACLRCGGTLKPNVTFFGENVPRSRVEAAFTIVNTAEALLVAGSSLTVFSGFRFVDGAARSGIPVVILNIGATRGDPLAVVRIDAPLGMVLPQLVDMLLEPLPG